MDYKRLSFGLGLFSLALGAAELFATRPIARALDAEDHGRLIKGFGARELVAGAGLVTSPAHAARVWNRVAGDAMDLAALAGAARKSPGNKTVWGALAFVAAVTVLDIVTARALDQATGKTAPVRG